jgi:hypothetical protein
MTALYVEVYLLCVIYISRLKGISFKMGTVIASDNKFRELATVCLPWQQWMETLV